MSNTFRKKPGAASHSWKSTPSIDMREARRRIVRAREVASADQHASGAGSAANHGGDRARDADRGPSVRPCRRSRASATSLLPRTIRAPACDTSAPPTAACRQTPAARRAATVTQSESCRLAGSIKARSLRIGSARNQIGSRLARLPVLRKLEPFEPRRRRQLRRDADVLGFERPHERLVHRQRAGLRRLALRPAWRRTARTVRARLRARMRRAPDWRSPHRRSRSSAATTGTACHRNQRHAADGEERHHRHQRQRVTDERRVLEQQMKHEIGTGKRDHRRQRSPIAPQQLHQAGGGENQHHGRERGRVPRMRRTSASARTPPRADSD